jgi:hypothetical protein
VEITRSGRTLRNVVASLAGAGPVAEETVIVGAHYDHLGRGGWGSLAIGANEEIHNGADDNASGTAVLLEVARQLAARGEPLRRRVLFIAFSAEELGLIGSRRYVQDPLVPLQQTVGMLNLDMVGRLRKDRLTIYGTGTAAEWDAWIPPAAATRELTILPRPGGYGPSDHATFYERGIPVLHFFTGFHAEYHRPGDDAPLVNVPGLRRIAGLVADLVVQTADAETRLKPASSQSIPLLAEMYGVGELLNGSEPDGQPRLGVYLDDAASDRGVIVTRIVQRGAAERAGLRAGDRLLRLDDHAVATLDDVRSYVGERKRGDSVTVEFERQGIRREVRVTL